MKKESMHFFSRLKLLLTIAALVSSVAATAGEPPTEPILRIDPNEHTSPITRIATDDAGRYLVTAALDKTARVWNLADGRLLTTLRPPIGSGHEGKLYAVALSPDGQIVALGGFTQSNNGATSLASEGMDIFLFDRASGRLLRRLTGAPGAINHLAFSSNGRILAAVFGGNHSGLRLISVDDGRLLAEDRDYSADSYSVHFSPHVGSDRAEHLITTCWDGYLRSYLFNENQLTLRVKRTAPGGQHPFAARFSPDGNSIAVGFDDKLAVNVLSAFDLSLKYAPSTAGINSDFLVSVAWSQQGDFLYAGGGTNAEFDGNMQNIRRWPTHGNDPIRDWSAASDTLIDMVALKNGRLVFGSGEPSWGVINTEGKRILLHTPVASDFRSNLQGFTLSSDGAQVHFSYESFGKSPAVFDSQKRTFVEAHNLTAPILSASGLNVTGWKSTTVPKLNGTLLKLQMNETSHCLALLPQGDGFVLGADWYLRLFDRNGAQRWQQVANSEVIAVNVSQDGRWVVAAYGDGTIRWHRASDGVEQLAFFPHADKKRWVMWTPSGYYDASPGAEDLIGWHVNHGKDQAADFFPASRFRDRFHRPDVLDKILDTQDESVALRLANTESGRRAQTSSITQLLPPVVEILSPSDGSGVSGASITLKYSTRSPDDAPVTGLRARVNGLAVTLPESRNLVVAATGSATSGTREITVPIPPQDSEIQLFAENKNGISTPATLRVTWAGKVAAKEEDSRFKPKLYVLAVGVSKYKNPDYNLGLAAKDATDFAKAFQKQKGKLYGDVVVRLLTDDKASKDDVLDGLDWLKSQVTSRDVGIMFLAGHGINDNTGNYYFGTYNINPEQLLRTGVAQNDIKLTLNSLAGKALFFVDTCHAGNALGTGKTRAIGGGTDAFVNELASAENGVIVFSSSTGRQLSQEDPAWGNGAFTKAVVEGLNGKADFQKSGKISQKGLDYYVTERVKELTKGQQSPVSIAPGGITDFPIAVVEK